MEANLSVAKVKRAKASGRNYKPRNLAKSVTVEKDAAGAGGCSGHPLVD